MTLRNRGARILLASLILTTCSLVARAADPVVPEAQDLPPTAPLPGSDPLGTPAAPEAKPTVPPAPVVATPTPAPVVTPTQPAAPSPAPSAPGASAMEEIPPAAEAQPQASPEPSPSSKIEDVIVDVKQDEPDWPNINKKRYLEYRSHWAVQADLSPGALGRNLNLGGNNSDGNAVNSQPWGVGLALEYQPDWFQHMGILSFGPSLNLYPSFSSNDDFPNAEAIWSVGAQIRYQFRYKEQQFIVPMVGFSYEKLQYHLVTEGTGSLGISGPVLGLEVLLNPLDPDNATAFYFDAGVLKTYLVFEGRLLSGDNGSIDVSGLSWFFGVRMEF